MLPLLLTVILPLAARPACPQWTDPAGRSPTSHTDWLARRAETDIIHSGCVLATGNTDVVAVIVAAGIYPDIAPEIAQFCSDLVAAGYSPRVDTMRGSSAAALRTLLSSIASIRGAVLVGDLPVAWFEADWGGSHPEEFPCDIYYMDLDGTWLDSDADGLFDRHTGSIAPEIWVGRLYAGSLTWDSEVRLLRRYFAKNHAYRTGGLTLPDRALCFIDNDWAGSGDWGLGQVYPSVTVIDDSRTTAAGWRSQLVTGYEWIQVASHSSAWGNTFRSDGSDYTGTVFNCEIYALRPQAHFYNLFCCSGARFIEENYSAGWEVFNDDWGLLAVGSTKTGSMLNTTYFYGCLGNNVSIGSAFQAWLIQNQSNIDWHYGMVMIGDPSLRPRHAALAAAPDPQPALAVSLPPVVEPVGAHPETDADPALVRDPQGRHWAAWVTGRTPANGRFDIYAARRSAGSWSDAMPVGNAYYWECDPALGIDTAGRPVLVWSRFEDSYHYNLYYSVFNGSSWSTPGRISEDPSEDMKAALVRDGSGRLWCLWQSARTGTPDIYACWWNGTAWSLPANLTGDTAIDEWPAVATDLAGRPWVVWTRRSAGRSEIRARYYDGSWRDAGIPSGSRPHALRPTVTGAGDGTVLVAWSDFAGDSGRICAAGFDGTSWSTPVIVSSGLGLSVRPALATALDGTPWLAWSTRTTPGWSVAISYYSGGVWQSPTLLSGTATYCLNPAAAPDSAAVRLVWQGYTSGGNWEIYSATVPLTGIAVTPGLSAPAGALEVWPSISSGPVNFSLPAAAGDPLVIYDRTGRQVRILPATGRAVVSADLSDLGPGVYFARAGTAGTRAVTIVR